MKAAASSVYAPRARRGSLHCAAIAIPTPTSEQSSPGAAAPQARSMATRCGGHCRCGPCSCCSRLSSSCCCSWRCCCCLIRVRCVGSGRWCCAAVRHVGAVAGRASVQGVGACATASSARTELVRKSARRSRGARCWSSAESHGLGRSADVCAGRKRTQVNMFDRRVQRQQDARLRALIAAAALALHRAAATARRRTLAHLGAPSSWRPRMLRAAPGDTRIAQSDVSSIAVDGARAVVGAIGRRGSSAARTAAASAWESST